MASFLVKVLRHLNDGINRTTATMDKVFVKALVIGLCHVKSIEKNEPIHKDMYIFMKGSANGDIQHFFLNVFNF